MIVLHVFGPGFGLADPSPFVSKALMLLKIASLDFTVHRADVRKSPKHKLPVIIDDGETIADSTFIRFHIEKKYGFDYDAGLTSEQKAICWAAEKLCEDHLYWMAMRERWLDDNNFENGPARFFDIVPGLLRPLVKSMVRKQVRKSLHAQGTGRHSKEENAILARRAIDTVATLLGDKTYFMGDKPCGADATIYSFMAGGACPVFQSDIRNAIETHRNLLDYIERMNKQYFPELAKAA